MAEFGVNIDTVYQTVQALANKEQRGYITPQEFNLFANQAQLDIFEQYFYDLNAFAKAQQVELAEIGDNISLIRQKLQPWTRSIAIGTGTTLPAGARYGRIINQVKGGITPREISPDEHRSYMSSKWHSEGSATASESFYWRQPTNGANQQITHKGVGTGEIEYVIGRPKLVYWGYIVVNEKAIYDPQASSHFEIHSAEQPDIIIKVLELAGVSIEDAQLIQYASGEEAANTADERI